MYKMGCSGRPTLVQYQLLLYQLYLYSTNFFIMSVLTITFYYRVYTCNIESAFFLESYVSCFKRVH